MILPTKHTTIEQSLIGFGSYLLTSINSAAPVTVDSLWQKYVSDYRENRYPVKHSFDSLLLTLVFLHALDAIEDHEGELKICS
jgi:hypothetical protein